MATVNLRSFQTFFDTLDQKIEKPLKQHLKNVYSSLAIAIMAAAVGSYVHVLTDIMKGNFLSAIGAIIVLMCLYATPHNSQNQNLRMGYLLGFSFLTGLGTGPLLEVVISVNPSIISTAFLGTCIVFGCFTLAALCAPDRKFLYLGGTLLSLLSTLFWMSLFNLFFGSQVLVQVNLYLGLVVMCGFILYDTQLIIEKSRRGDNDFIWHAVDLFIDFMDIFRRLMIILAQKEQQNNRKKKDT